jgi:hypothetical protein
MSSDLLFTPQNNRICVSLTTPPSPPEARHSRVLQVGEAKMFPTLPLYTGRLDDRRRNRGERVLKPRPIYGSIMLARASTPSDMELEQSDMEARPQDMPMVKKQNNSVFRPTFGPSQRRRASLSSRAA